MPEDAGVLTDGDDEGDWEEEEKDEADDEHVVQQPAVVFAATVDDQDEVEGTDDDDEDAKYADAERDAGVVRLLSRVVLAAS